MAFVVVRVRNILHGLGYLSTWSLAVGAVWGGLGSAVLKEEVCHSGRALSA